MDHQPQQKVYFISKVKFHIKNIGNVKLKRLNICQIKQKTFLLKNGEEQGNPTMLKNKNQSSKIK